QARLKRAGVASPRLDAEVLLAEATKSSREDLFRHPESVLTAAQGDAFETLLRRREKREPVAYLLGRKEFWNLEIGVNPHVLIPRPETEILVDQGLQFFRSRRDPKGPRLLEVGTGSGAVALVLAQELPECRVTALEVSPAALETARDNARRHGLADRIRGVRGAFFPGREEGGFDGIVSNPPYLESAQIEGLMPEVRDFEPRLALDGGPDGLNFYRRFLPEAWKHLTPGGALFLEIGETQAAAVSDLISKSLPYGPVRIFQDYSGRDRVIHTFRRNHG
ncbi:MAG: peptide chain release factor N(5)-glutamine methyltransferase, partial [Nitrospinaceae bacterium]|nr:peptide chain release factor N(5)-glutamine methyltransferase [Nitrospinaceae bacterium]